MLLQALVSDSSVAFVHQSRETMSIAEMPQHVHNWDTVGKVLTLFGKSWTLVIMDDVHNFHKINQSY